MNVNPKSISVENNSASFDGLVSKHTDYSLTSTSLSSNDSVSEDTDSSLVTSSPDFSDLDFDEDVDLYRIKFSAIKLRLNANSLIGRSACATVWLGEWNGKDAAIKTMQFDDFVVDKAAYDREKDIMQQLTQLHAPHVIEFYGYAMTLDTYCIVMEYGAKGSVGDLIMKNNINPFDLSVRYEWAKELAQAVSFLHQHQIVHRDIKSFNVLIDGNDQVKLCDFGAAKKIDGNIDMVGTPGWMAPEVMWKDNKPQPHIEKSDIFSLSVTMWELMAWKFPFEGYKYSPKDKMRVHLLHAIAAGKRETIPNDCPPKMAKLITWGWQKKLEDRPTAEELVTELSSDVGNISGKVARL